MPNFRLPREPTRLAAWLYELIEGTDLRTYADVGAKLHRSPTTIKNLMEGKPISLDTVEAISRGFDIPRSFLIAKVGDQLEERARRSLATARPNGNHETSISTEKLEGELKIIWDGLSPDRRRELLSVARLFRDEDQRKRPAANAS